MHAEEDQQSRTGIHVEKQPVQSFVQATTSSRAGVGFGLLTLFLFGIGLGQGQFDGVARVGLGAFNTIADAHYAIYLARENVNAAGESEYALLLEDGGQERLRAFLSTRPGWHMRDAAVPGWTVVAAPGAAGDVMSEVRGEPYVRIAVRNRGLWICH